MAIIFSILMSLGIFSDNSNNNGNIQYNDAQQHNTSVNARGTIWDAEFGG